MTQVFNAAIHQVTLRFYEELNDFLKPSLRKTDIQCCISYRQSVRDLIESFNVPHVEVDLILVNGQSEGFDYCLQDGDRISVYPVFEAFSIAGVSLLRDKGLRVTRFVLDVHLGKLARNLRLLGFDVDYARYRDDADLAIISQTEQRILLTRDTQLLKRSNVQRGLYVRNTDPEKQTVEILNRLQLWDDVKPLTRCLVCNGLIQPTSATPETAAEAPPRVREKCHAYSRCTGCGKLYWEGDHYEHMKQHVARIMRSGSHITQHPDVSKANGK